MCAKIGAAAVLDSCFVRYISSGLGESKLARVWFLIEAFCRGGFAPLRFAAVSGKRKSLLIGHPLQVDRRIPKEKQSHTRLSSTTVNGVTITFLVEGEAEVHARVRRQALPKTISTRLTADERDRVAVLARQYGLTPSGYLRKVLLDCMDMSTDHRLILAEVCATRHEIGTLLQTISDLDEGDITRARREADSRCPALVEQRILELKQAREDVRGA